MKTRNHKVQSFVVTMVLGASVLFGAVSVNAATGNWADNTAPLPTSVGDTYTITTPGQLAALAAAVNGGNTFSGKTIVLANDLNLSAHYWTPIGTYNNYNITQTFQGTFDGKSNTVTGLTIATTNTLECAGLFGCISRGGEVQNVALVDTSIFVYKDAGGDAYAGGVAGINYNGTILNCSNSGSVSSSLSYSSSSFACAGGVTGDNYGTIKNCSNSGNVSSSSSTSSYTHTYAGGVAGSTFQGTITNCSNSGDVSASSSYSYTYAGGVAGKTFYDTITDCSNSGSVSTSSSSIFASSSSYAGGVTGDNYGTIKNCSNSGSVSSSTSSSASSRAGGVVGYNSGTIMNCSNSGNVSTSSSSSSDTTSQAGGVTGYNSGIIKNCSNSGSVSASSSYFSTSYAGGIAGDNEGSGVISDCSNSGDISASSSSSYASSRAGGVAGYTNGIIKNCSNSGSVSASSSSAYAGGVAGYNSGTISNCSNSGSVSTSSSSGGGVAGLNIGSIVSDCYWKRDGSEGFNWNATGVHVGATNNLISFGNAPGTLASPHPVYDTDDLLAVLNAWVAATNAALGEAAYCGWEVKAGVNGGYPFLDGLPMPPVATYEGVVANGITFDASGGVVLGFDVPQGRSPEAVECVVYVSLDLSDPDGWVEYHEGDPDGAVERTSDTSITINKAALGNPAKAFFKVSVKQGAFK